MDTGSLFPNDGSIVPPQRSRSQPLPISKSRPVWIVLIVVLPFLSNAGDPSETQAHDSTATMIQRLREIGDDPAFVTPYRNDVHLAALLQRREADPEEFAGKLAARSSLALQALRAGDSELAVREFRASLEIDKASSAPTGDGAAAIEGRKQAVFRRRLLTELLALAYLRMGEQKNCLENHNADSCLLPIRDGGLHKDPRGSQAAIELYRSLLRSFPDDPGYRWCLRRLR